MFDILFQISGLYLKYKLFYQKPVHSYLPKWLCWATFFKCLQYILRMYNFVLLKKRKERMKKKRWNHLLLFVLFAYTMQLYKFSSWKVINHLVTYKSSIILQGSYFVIHRYYKHILPCSIFLKSEGTGEFLVLQNKYSKSLF